MRGAIQWPAGLGRPVAAAVSCMVDACVLLAQALVRDMVGSRLATLLALAAAVLLWSAERAVAARAGRTLAGYSEAASTYSAHSPVIPAGRYRCSLSADLPGCAACPDACSIDVAVSAAAAGAEATVVSYEWHVRIKRAAPDCFSKEVIVVNGEFQPSITVRQGNVLQV